MWCIMVADSFFFSHFATPYNLNEKSNKHIRIKLVED